jgi:FkbM family methyltransferase
MNTRAAHDPRWLTARLAALAVRTTPPWLRKRFYKLVKQHFAASATSYITKDLFGNRFVCDLRDNIQRRIFFFGQWEPCLTDFFSKNIEGGDIVIDVGANIGYFSLLASRLVGKAGRVHAIEAEPTIFKKLIRNIKLNEVSTIETHNLAAGNLASSVEIFGGPVYNTGRSGTNKLDDSTTSCVVPMKKLADIVGPDALARSSLIKIDVEGGEEGILAELADHVGQLNQRLSIVCEISDWANDGIRRALEVFRANGFNLLLVRNTYSDSEYMKRQSDYLSKLTTWPSRQCDVLITRQFSG